MRHSSPLTQGSEECKEDKKGRDKENKKKKEDKKACTLLQFQLKLASSVCQCVLPCGTTLCWSIFVHQADCKKKDEKKSVWPNTPLLER